MRHLTILFTCLLLNSLTAQNPRTYAGTQLEGVARGVGFFMGYIASTALIFSIDTDLSSTNDNASYRSSQQSKAFIGLGGMLLTWIWSTSDAVRVAKVNNMA